MYIPAHKTHNHFYYYLSSIKRAPIMDDATIGKRRTPPGWPSFITTLSVAWLASLFC